MSKLVDCSRKAVAAGLLTKEEAAAISEKAKGLAETMPRRDAEVAAARSMVQDGIAQLQNIRQQLGKADPIREQKVIFRSTNKEAALAAMMDETQAIVEQKTLDQAKALQGDQGKMMAAEQATEDIILGTVSPEIQAGLKAKAGKQKAAPRPVDRQAEITAAVERLNKNPEERLAIYQKARDRMLSLMKEHRIEIAGMEFARGMTPAEREAAGIKKAPEQHEIQREKMLSAMGELNALLKFLPAEVRGKVGGFFQLAQGGVGETELADFFTKRVKMVERELEAMLKRDYLGQIKQLLKQTKPKEGSNKVKKSRIGDAQVAADLAGKAVAMDEDQTATRLAELQAAMTNPDLTPEEHSALLYEHSITALFGDLAHQSAETIAAAYNWLRDTAARGRAEWGVKEEKRLEQVRGWIAEIEAGLPEVGQEGVSKVSRPVSAAQWINSFALEHYSFTQFLEHILPDGASVVKRWQAAARRGDNATQDYQRKAGDRLTEHLKAALDTTSRMKIGGAIKLLMKKETATKAHGGAYGVTRLDAIKYILDWAQPDVRAKMENQKKLPWVQADIDQLAAMTQDEASQAVLSFLRDEYAKGHSIVSPVYKRMNGMDLPQTPNYAPTRYHNAGQEQELSIFGGPVSTSGVTPSFLIGRVKHNAIVRQENALTVYWQHITQMAHYVNNAELIREMRGVLGNPDVKLAIEQKYGKHMAQDVGAWIDALARQGGNKAAELGTINSALTTLLAGKAVASLGLNLKTIMAQVDSSMRFIFTGIGPKRIIAAMTDPKFIETIPIAWHSDTIQRRLKGGASPEARYLFDQARTSPSMMLELSRRAMLPLQWVDAKLTSFTAAVSYRDAYNEAIKNGLDEAHAQEYAADQMDESVYRYSQPTGLASKSLHEVSGSVPKKIFLMFMSDMRLKSAILQEGVRGVVKNPADISSWGKIAAVEGMALLARFFANLYRDVFTDDEDEDIWTAEGWILAMATAPLSGYVMVGTAAELGISAMLGQKAWAPSRDPIVEATQRIPSVVKHWDQTFNLDDRKAMLREWDNLARALAVSPTMAAPAVIINALKPVILGIENDEKED